MPDADLNPILQDEPPTDPETRADDERFRPPAQDEPPQDQPADLPDLDSALASLGTLGREAYTLPDMDAALAALSGMDSLDGLALDESESLSEEAEAAPAPSLPAAPATPATMPADEDGLIGLERGQAASFVPAFLLMLGGGALTLWLSSGNPMPPWGLLLGLAALALGISLLAQWWSGGRWSEGNLFMGLLLALGGGVGLFLEAAPNFHLANGYPLFIIAAGLALLLSVALSAVPRPGLAAAGLSLALAGLLALAYTLGNFSPQALELAAQAAPFALGLALAFLVLPLFVRRR